jgi:proteasome lid subunit RPN8/RPN11
MAIFLSHETLSRFHDYAQEAHPNETHAAFIGFAKDNDIFITDYLPSVIKNPNPQNVHADIHRHFQEGEFHYVIGFVHTHPGENTGAFPSEGDHVSWYETQRMFLERFHRKPLFMLYAPYHHDLTMFTMTVEKMGSGVIAEQIIAGRRNSEIFPVERRDYTVLERMPDPPPKDQKELARLREREQQFLEKRAYEQKSISEEEKSELAEWLPFIFFWLDIAGIIALLILFPWSLFLLVCVIVLGIIALWLGWVAADK